MRIRSEEVREFDYILEKSFSEDTVSNDVTSLALVKGREVKAVIVSRQRCVLAGLVFLPRIFKKRDKKISVKILKKDGAEVKKNCPVCEISGPAEKIFSVERIALNFLGFLSGIATKTRKLKKIVDSNWNKGKKPVLLDTRKTIPGFRFLSKYAVRCGGGANYRFNLSEITFVKDNHKAVSGTDFAIRNLKNKKVVFEADNLMEARKILEIKPFVLLCDNFSPEMLKKVVKLRDRISPSTLIEISGGIDVNSVGKYRGIPVDRISSGAITHSAVFADFSMEVAKSEGK